ncbi:Transmembrane protein [Orchesella cincta]|uniref:Transmembrane protein n=1 Tax=Orchesella cincta TaxID=48709 RepID=A0A1D2M845_ORCCI|nr:Transmembrane protein [Orchesella cincta]
MESKPERENDYREGDPGTKPYSGITKLRNFLAPRRLDLATWVTRLFSIFFTLFVIIPIFGDPSIAFRRSLIANAATSGIRLYQRLPRPYSFSKYFFAQFILEDSWHYLCFTLQMLKAVKGPICEFQGVGSFFSIWTAQTGRILKAVASAEVALMGLILLNCFRGYMSIIAPFAYYRFLTFRYASRRNPNMRTVFYEMRMALEKFNAGGSCPILLGKVLRMGISLVCKLAPITTPS